MIVLSRKSVLLRQEFVTAVGIDLKEINYKDLKEEILTFLVINMFSLICKL